MNILYFTGADYAGSINSSPYYIPLKHYSWNETRLIFVYGADFPLRNIHRNFFKTLACAWIHVALIVPAMIILLCLRHGDVNRSDIFMSVYMDIMIAITGASHLRYGNGLEKIFFTILLAGAFLINTIALENFLFLTFITEEPNRMDSLEKYIDFNPPTLISPGFEDDFRYNALGQCFIYFNDESAQIFTFQIPFWIGCTNCRPNCGRSICWTKFIWISGTSIIRRCVSDLLKR